MYLNHKITQFSATQSRYLAFMLSRKCCLSCFQFEWNWANHRIHIPIFASNLHVYQHNSNVANNHADLYQFSDSVLLSYKDGAGNTAEKNSSIFSLTQMH